MSSLSDARAGPLLPKEAPVPTGRLDDEDSNNKVIVVALYTYGGVAALIGFVLMVAAFAIYVSALETKNAGQGADGGPRYALDIVLPDIILPHHRRRRRYRPRQSGSVADSSVTATTNASSFFSRWTARRKPSTDVTRSDTSGAPSVVSSVAADPETSGAQSGVSGVSGVTEEVSSVPSLPSVSAFSQAPVTQLRRHSTAPDTAFGSLGTLA